jgi:hypothetical protein
MQKKFKYTLIIIVLVLLGLTGCSQKLRIKMNDDINVYKKDGTIAFKTEFTDILEVIKIQPCLKNKKDICWLVKSEKSEEIGIVSASEMYELHSVLE